MQFISDINMPQSLESEMKKRAGCKNYKDIQQSFFFLQKTSLFDIISRGFYISPCSLRRYSSMKCEPRYNVRCRKTWGKPFSSERLA